MTSPNGVLGYPIFERTCANGLRVIVSPDHSAPAVAVNLWYDVGSRDEPGGATGVAHLFEHLMFQGSTNVQSGEHLAAIQNAGGSVNATTWFDRTNYFQTVPTGALDLALWLEADRLATLGDSLSKENLDTQRDVVKEEKRQRYDNVPYGNVMADLLELTFPPDHPYAHSTIGSMADLDAFTLSKAKKFFSRHYAPNNAVLTLVGDIEPEEGFTRVERFFGHIPAVALTPRAVPPRLAPHVKPASHERLEAVPADAVYLAWRIPPATEPEYDALELACDILGGGHASRWYRRLVRFEELADGAGAATLCLVGGNALAYGYARALPNGSIDPILPILFEEVERFAETGPSPEEMARSLIQAERLWLSQLSDFTTRADQLSAHALLFGDPDRVNTRLAEMSQISAAEVQAAAGTYLTNPAILTIKASHD